jgi:hypothetical protein
LPRGRLLGLAVACGLVAAVVGAFVLEPWTLFVDQRGTGRQGNSRRCLLGRRAPSLGGSVLRLLRRYRHY